jgi:SAM-dependent methyltransferase
MAQEWFASWFDTHYYHMLYKYRDDTEARTFIDALFETLKPEPNHKILDLACGRGRHAIYMNKKGFDVTGYDLSGDSISFAHYFENERLRFDVRDMREDLGTEEFDWVFNLFTSFGYFENDEDEGAAMRAIARCLKPGGKLVIDFMNAEKVAENLVPEEVKMVQDITFNIRRYIDDNQIVKEINFEADDRTWRFEERVKKYSRTDFKELFSTVGLVPLAYFGGQMMEPFDSKNSDRLILVVAKP